MSKNNIQMNTKLDRNNQPIKYNFNRINSKNKSTVIIVRRIFKGKEDLTIKE